MPVKAECKMCGAANANVEHFLVRCQPAAFEELTQLLAHRLCRANAPHTADAFESKEWYDSGRCYRLLLGDRFRDDADVSYEVKRETAAAIDRVVKNYLLVLMHERERRVGVFDTLFDPVKPSHDAGSSGGIALGWMVPPLSPSLHIAAAAQHFSHTISQCGAGTIILPYMRGEYTRLLC